MLNRGFKPAKCKTALNLAKARIKLMKNKKDVQMKQLRREIAQLLQNGQDQTARIRVEHVVREEKTLAAYEMIEIYCELVVARLPIIESQKICPLDLKESITSLIFAAPRCADIPELQDVRKHFTAKYGKDFITTALELRPASGVSRTLVEKLSVKAPDGPAKVKILKGIAEEHSIQWEPNWFKDEDPVSSGDILNTPHINTSNTIQMEPLNVQIADDLEEKHPHNTENFDISSQSHARANTKEIPLNPTSRPDVSLSGTVSEEKLFGKSSGTENPYLPDSQDWNMGFKDATAAAQAAAESAERASMAARAAAQLSIRDSSHGPARMSLHGQHKHEQGSSFNQRSPRMKGHQGYTGQQGDLTERLDDKNTNKEFSQSGVQYDSRHQEFRESKSQSRDPVSNPSTSKGDSNWSNSSNIQEYETESTENPFWGDNVGPPIQPSKFYAESSGFRDELGASNKVDAYSNLGALGQGTSDQDNWHAETTNPSKFNSMKDETISRDYGEKDVFKEPDENKYGFVSSSVFDGLDLGSSESDINEKVGHNVTNVVFDESGSDDDVDHIFDPAEKDGSPFDKFSPRHSLLQKENPHFEPDLSESFRESPIYKKLIEPLPVTFDDYDEPSPRSEKELQTETFDPEIGSYNHGKPTSDNRGTDDEGKGLESPRSFRLPSESKGCSPEFDYETYSSSEGGTELNLGSLPSGRRNRPNLRAPYTRGDFTAVSSPSRFSKATNEGFVPNEDNSPALKFQMPSGQMSSGKVSSRYDTPTEFEAVISPSHFDTEKQSYSENVHETRGKGRTIYSKSDEKATGEDVLKPIMTKNLQGAGISRRTKGSAKTGRISSSSRTDNQSDLNDNDDTFELRSGTNVSRKNNSFSPVSVEKPVTPSTSGTATVSGSSEKAPSRENSGKNLGHVHPKLPDFETFTAHLQSLRTNRQ